ncbi:MAG: Zn-ribbon domain-containing OB-fold protein [Caldilineaceae bacterium]|nr:Zn-ribbon domain-containing OB-fold protein [Caldilineaceae bacterium]
MKTPQTNASTAQLTHNLSGRGEVYSFSAMYNAPHGFDDQKPYTIALIKLDDGPMVTAQLTDVSGDEVTIGMRVEMVTRKLREDGPEGQIIYGYKFRPLLSRDV